MWQASPTTRAATGSPWAGADGSIELWNTTKATRISRHTDHAAGARERGPGGSVPVQVAFSGTLLASSSVVDNMIRLWDPRTGAGVGVPECHARLGHRQGTVVAGVLPANGRVLFTNSDLNSITAWDLLNGSCRVQAARRQGRG